MLPDLLALAEEFASRLGADAVHALDRGEWPSAALSFAGQRLFLLRDHHGSVSLSLPTDHRWSLRTRADVDAVVSEIVPLLTAYRAAHPKVVSLADAIVAIVGILGTNDWIASFPGTPVPSEAWLTSGERRVGLFQEGTSVKVVVWASSKMQSLVLRSIDTAKLEAWLPRAIDEQVARNAADAAFAAAEEARKKALPIPSVDEVLRRLRSGVSFQVGGGRYHQTYFMGDDVVRRRTFDEGYEEVDDIDEATLRAAIERHPDEFGR